MNNEDIKCEEMAKLVEMLKSYGIGCNTNLECFENYYKFITTFYWQFEKNKQTPVSVINGYGTYGGYSSVRPTNAGLLEMRIGESEPIGSLTANEVIKYLGDHSIQTLPNGISATPNSLREEAGFKPISVCDRLGHNYTDIRTENVCGLKTFCYCTRCGKGIMVKKWDEVE